MYMNKSSFILNDEVLKIESILYKDGELTIKTCNNYILNINLNFDITKLNDNSKENISKKIYIDQNFITEKYYYVIDIGNSVYLTKNKNHYLLEIYIPKVNVLIPPFDIISNKRLDINDSQKLEIKKLEVKIYFNNSIK